MANWIERAGKIVGNISKDLKTSTSSKKKNTKSTTPKKTDTSKASTPSKKKNSQTTSSAKSTGSWQDKATRILEANNYVPPEKRLYDLILDNGKNFGKVSYGAHEAIKNNKLDKYMPKDPDERKALNNFRSYVGYQFVGADGKPIGKISYDGYNALVNGTYEKYKPKNKEEKATIDKAKKETIVPLAIEVDGKTRTFGNVSFNAIQAINHNKLDSYKPVNNAEKKAIDKFKKHVALSNLSEEEQRVFKKYGINPITFSHYDFVEWAESIGYEYRHTEGLVSDYKLMPKDNENTWNPFDLVPSKEEQQDFQTLKRFDEREVLKSSSKNAPIYGSVVTVLTSPYTALAGVVGAGKNAVEVVLGKDITTNDKAHNIVEDVNIIRGTVTEEYASDWFGGASGKLGNYGSLTYNGLMSIGDMVVLSLVTKGIGSRLGLTEKALTAFSSNATSALLASSSTASTIMEKKKEGYSDEKAVASGFATGVAEFITEKFALEEIFGAPGSFIKKGLVSFFAEFIEEGSSDAMSKAADYLIAGNDSAIKRNINAYIQDGKSKKEATKLAIQDSLWETLSNAVVGGFSGVAVGSVYDGFRVPEIRQTGKTIRPIASKIVQGGLDLDKKSEAYKHAKKLSNKDASKISDYELGLQHIYNTKQAEYEQEIKTKKINKEVQKEPLTVNTGDTFIDTKTNNTITVVERNDNTSTVEITTDGKTEIKTLPNERVNSLISDLRYTKVNTSVANDVQNDTDVTADNVVTKDASRNANAPVDNVVTEDASSNANAPADNVVTEETVAVTDTSTLNIGDTFVNTKTKDRITVVDRNDTQTTVKIITPNEEVFTKVVNNSQADKAFLDGRYQKIDYTLEEPATNEAETDNESITSEVETSAPRDINLTRYGNYYAVYGEDAKILAANLKTKTQKRNVNGVSTDVLLLPADMAQEIAPVIAEDFNFIFSDVPSTSNATTEIKNAPVANETVVTEEETSTGGVGTAEERIYDVANAINDTLIPDVKEGILTGMNNKGVDGGLVEFAKPLIRMYRNEGTLGGMEKFFIDKGARVIDTIEGRTEAISEVETTTTPTEIETTEVAESPIVPEMEIAEEVVADNATPTETVADEVVNETETNEEVEAPTSSETKTYVSGNTGTKDGAIIDEIGNNSVVKAIERDKSDVATAMSGVAEQTVEMDKPVEVVYVPDGKGNGVYAAYFAQTKDSRGGQIASVNSVSGNANFDNIYDMSFVNETGFMNKDRTGTTIAKTNFEGNPEAVKQLVNNILENKGQTTFTMDDIDVNNFNDVSCALFSEVSKYLPDSIKSKLGFKSQSFGNLPRYIKFGGINSSVNTKNAVNIDQVETASGKYVDVINELFAMDDAQRESVINSIDRMPATVAELNAITENRQAEVLNNQPKSDTIVEETVTEESPVEREDNGNEQERSGLLHGDGKRGNDKSTRKYAGDILPDGRQNESRTSTERKNFARELIERGQTEQVTVENNTFELIKPEAYNDEMKAMVEKAEADGKELGFFVGRGTMTVERKDGTKQTKLIKGVKTSDGKIYVQYDADEAPQSVYKHEFCHDEWDTPEMQKAAKSILDSLTEKEKEEILSLATYQTALNGYTEYFEGDVEKAKTVVWEEFVCDVMSGLNDYTEKYADVVNEYWEGTETTDTYKASEYTESIDAGGDTHNTENDNARYKFTDEENNLLSILDDLKGQKKILYNGGRAIKIPNSDMAVLRHTFKTEEHYSTRSDGLIDCISCSGNHDKKHYFYVFIKGYESRVMPIFRMDYSVLDSYISEVRKISKELGYKSDEFIRNTQRNGKGLDRIRGIRRSDSSNVDDASKRKTDSGIGGLFDRTSRQPTQGNNDRNNSVLSDGKNEETQHVDDKPKGTRWSFAEEDNLKTQKRIEGIAQEIGSHEEFIELAKQNTQEFVGKIKENKNLQKRLDNAKRQMLKSPKPAVNEVKVGKITQEILKEVDSTLNAKDLREEITSIYNEYFAAVKDAKGVESKVNEANDIMLDRFAKLAVDIANSGEAFTESEEYEMLKSYIKNTRIKVPDSAKADAHYAEFRKSHMGTFNLTNDGTDVDIVYKELCSLFPGKFDTEISHPADQLLEMDRVLEGLKPYAYNPHLEYMEDVIEHIVNRFAYEVDGLAVMPKTKAEKMAEKSAYDKEIALEKERKSFEQKLDKHKKDSEDVIRKLQKKIDDAKYVGYWEGRLSKEEKAKALKELRDKRDSANLKAQIRNIVSDMKQNLYKTEDKGGYPKELVKAAAEVLGALDFRTGKTNKDGSPTVTTLNLEALKAEYDALATNPNYDFESEYNATLSAKIEALRTEVNGKRVNELTKDELTSLKEILSDIRHTLSVASKQISNKQSIEDSIENAHLVMQAIEELSAMDDVAKQEEFWKGMKLAIADFDAFILNPGRVFEMIANYDKNSALYKLFDLINRGERVRKKFRMDATMPFDELTDGGGNEVAFYDFRTKGINTGIKYQDGSDVVVPKSIICQLIMTWNRKAGKTHLAAHGCTIPDMKLFNKGERSEKAIKTLAKTTNKITQADIDRLKGMLDSYDKAWMERAHYFFNKVGKDAINEISLLLQGREIATTKDYIRLYVDSHYLGKEVELSDAEQTLESHGSLKKTKPGAKQPLILTGLQDAVYDHIDFTSKYYGLAIPIRNFKKVYNSKMEGTSGTTVQGLLDKKMGARIRSGVVDRYISELQAPRKKDLTWFDRVRGRVIGGMFWGKITSALKQTSSYWTAEAILSEKSLAKGLGQFAKHPKQTKAEIAKYSGTLYDRAQGLSTTELGDRANRKRLAGASNWVDKTINKYAPVLRKIPEGLRPGNWLQAMDVNTSAALWEACKAEVSKTMKATDEGYMQAVTDLWERVIEETQSNYDVGHRPEALKNTNALIQGATMFTTDLFQKSGIIHSAFGDYSAKSAMVKQAEAQFKKEDSETNKEALEKAKKAKKEASKRLSKAARSLVYSSVWLGVAHLLGQMLLRKFKPYIDEEEKEINAVSVAKQYAQVVAEDLFTSFVPGVGSAMFKVWGTFDEDFDLLNDISIDALEDCIKGASDIYTAATDDTENNFLGTFWDALPKVLAPFGLPAQNVKDLFISVKGYIGDIVVGEFAHDLEESSGGKSFYTYDDLAKYIVSGDKEKEKKLLDYYSANGTKISQGSLTSEIKPAYVQLFVDSPNEAYNIKRKLVLDYDYSTETINKWTIAEYFKHAIPGKKYDDGVVSDPEYASEIASAVRQEIGWEDTYYSTIRSKYKTVYKKGNEDDTEALRQALIHDLYISSFDISTWEQEADESIQKKKDEHEADKENYR